MSIMTPDNRIPENPPESQALPLETEPRPEPRPAPPPSGPVRYDPLNLAGRPFLNSRPVVRISLLLWMLGFLLLLGNVSLFWSYLSASEDKRAEIARGEQAIQRRQAEVRDLEARLNSIDLEDLNAEIRFLNGKIAERTFSWNLLLDHLARVLPNDVRLNRLQPVTADQARRASQGSRSARRGQPREGLVTLEILGDTRDDEALLRFVDNLFTHPFANPNLVREERLDEGSVVRFELTVEYIPDSQARDVVIEEVAAPAAPADPAAPAKGGRP